MGTGAQTGTAGDLNGVAESIKATGEAIKALEDILDGFSRSAILEIRNVSRRRLVMVDSGHVHGGFREPPSSSIEPMTSSVFGSGSSGFLTGTQGFARYALDDEGTIFHVEWEIPFVGANESGCRIEGTHKDFYDSFHITPVGNTKVHLVYDLGTRVTFAPRQADWRFCRKCMCLFFDGDVNRKGACPGGDGHEAAGFNFTLPHTVPGPNHQAEWRFCGKCMTLFFNGEPNKGICALPAPGSHEAIGFNFCLPHDIQGPNLQPGWRFCRKCKAMYFKQRVSPKISINGLCPVTDAAAGNHHDALGFSFCLPFNDDKGPIVHQPGPNDQNEWRFCTKCMSLFFNGDLNHKGACPGGASHEHLGFNFVLPHDRAPDANHQADWRFCGKCMSMFFAGEPNQGVCPVTGPSAHEAIGLNFMLPHDMPPAPDEQSEWRFCGKCKALFFDGDPSHKGACSRGGGHAGIGNDFLLSHR